MVKIIQRVTTTAGVQNCDYRGGFHNIEKKILQGEPAVLSLNLNPAKFGKRWIAYG